MNENSQGGDDETPLYVYCGVEAGGTDDRVIGRLLFTSPLPATMVTVPACNACQKKKSDAEQYLRDVLVADIAATDHPVAHTLLTGKVSRAVKTNRRVFAKQSLPRARLQPTFTPQGIYLGHQIVVPSRDVTVSMVFPFSFVRGRRTGASEVPPLG